MALALHRLGVFFWFWVLLARDVQVLPSKRHSLDNR
jgi:hypothetical protein